MLISSKLLINFCRLDQSIKRKKILGEKKGRRQVGFIMIPPFFLLLSYPHLPTFVFVGGGGKVN